MRKLLAGTALFGLMGVLSLGTNAQDFDPALFKLMRPAMAILGQNPSRILLAPDVQKELKMDEEQIKALTSKLGMNAGGPGGGGKERMAKMMEKLATLKDVAEDKLEGKIRELFKDEIEEPMKEVTKVLKPEQIKRLHEISRQTGGMSALLAPDVVKELKLSDDEIGKIKGISKEFDKESFELIEAGGGFRNMSAETREKLGALRKEANEKAEESLTKEQKDKWKEMKGEPFTGKVDFPRRPKKDN